MSKKPKFRGLQMRPLQLKTIPLSDSNKLVWAGVAGPMETAANHFNAMRASVYNQVAHQMAAAQGIDLDRYNFDVRSGEWVKRVKLPEGGGPS